MEINFAHEGMDVYQLGREINRDLAKLLRDYPRCSIESRDNLTMEKRSGKTPAPPQRTPPPAPVPES